MVEYRAADAVAFALRRKHSLDDIAAAARLGTWITHVPPLDRDRNHEHGGIHYRGDGHDRDDRPLPDAEQRLAYLYRRQHHEAGRYHVEHQPEIYGAEAAKERGGPARVAKLVELDVAFGLSTLRSRAS